MNKHIISFLKKTNGYGFYSERKIHSDKHAIFIETRDLEHLELVVHNHLFYLPNDWSYEVIVHNRIKDRFNEFQYISQSFTNDLTIESYNELMTSNRFWHNFPFAKKILICQSDSFFVGKHINNFLEYDYIGAGWTFQDKGGNGGFSLRSKDKMIETIKRVPYSHIHGNEDVYFCNHMKGRVCTRDEGQRFSTEAIFSLGTVGCHAIDKYLNEEQIKLICQQL